MCWKKRFFDLDNSDSILGSERFTLNFQSYDVLRLSEKDCTQRSGERGEMQDGPLAVFEEGLPARLEVSFYERIQSSLQEEHLENEIVGHVLHDTPPNSDAQAAVEAPDSFLPPYGAKLAAGLSSDGSGSHSFERIGD